MDKHQAFGAGFLFGICAIAAGILLSLGLQSILGGTSPYSRSGQSLRFLIGAVAGYRLYLQLAPALIGWLLAMVAWGVVQMQMVNRMMPELQGAGVGMATLGLLVAFGIALETASLPLGAWFRRRKEAQQK